jgi:hypothetical protein
MRWIKAMILGVILWYALTFLFGFIIALTGLKNISFFKDPNNSNFLNFVWYPLGLWLAFKITKTSFFGKKK